jgi:hypothetical protein
MSEADRQSMPSFDASSFMPFSKGMVVLLDMAFEAVFMALASSICLQENFKPSPLSFYIYCSISINRACGKVDKFCG